ncbi:MAG: hypothetical protein R3310_11365, partial [Candidatus Competibacteraceae bacterium]|nr:hypothetical protein [Candidatus Competibacteraceae bacterium]
ALTGQLADLPSVERVEANPRTAGLLIRHRGTAASLLEAARERGLFELSQRPLPSTPVLERAAQGVDRLDDLLTQGSRGSLDLRALLLLSLLAMLLVQFHRGQIMAPATTLIWYILDLLDRLRPRAG